MTSYVDTHYVRITAAKIDKRNSIRDRMIRSMRSALEASIEEEFYLGVKQVDVNLVLELLPGVMEEINVGATHALQTKFLYHTEKGTGGTVRVWYPREETTPPPSKSGTFVIARSDYTARQADELSFVVGDRLEVIEHYAYWWRCRMNGKTGYVPGPFMKSQ